MYLHLTPTCLCSQADFYITKLYDMYKIHIGSPTRVFRVWNQPRHTYLGPQFIPGIFDLSKKMHAGVYVIYKTWKQHMEMNVAFLWSVF